jgi:hypothetical protein
LKEPELKQPELKQLPLAWHKTAAAALPPPALSQE